MRTLINRNLLHQYPAMNHNVYLQQFAEAAKHIASKKLRQSGLQMYTGIVLDCVAIKLYKKEWSSDAADPVNASSRIFFSVWLSEKGINKQQLYYNIHAFKLRELPGHKISSRDFAAKFRSVFAQYIPVWENLRIDFGPLTLMEGWVPFSDTKLAADIIRLAERFTEVAPLIDQTLSAYKLTY
jgi:hypothetical protein